MPHSGMSELDAMGLLKEVAGGGQRRVVQSLPFACGRNW